VNRKLTRRKLALAIAGSGAAGALAQTPAPQNQPDDLEAARRRVHAIGALLAKYQVPMSTEPAFQFKA
jgi:hypothetical protein